MVLGVLVIVWGVKLCCLVMLIMCSSVFLAGVSIRLSWYCIGGFLGLVGWVVF